MKFIPIFLICLSVYLPFVLSTTLNIDDLQVEESGVGAGETDALAGETPPKSLTEEELLNATPDPILLTDDEISSASPSAENHEYQAEVARLLDIIVNSLYSTKDIFLRELISNATDALEKFKITALKQGLPTDDELSIRIRTFPGERKLTITDNGVGMTKSDLINNLGTIAKSGTQNFIDAISRGEGDSNLIGQFGVGFYSVFLVADTVVVQSKHSSDRQYVWKSRADSKYELYEDPRGNTLGEHGTRITLVLREDALEYGGTGRIRELVERYSRFVRYPIYLLVSEGENLTWTLVNDTPPIWARDKATISEEDYLAFYRAISGNKDPPLAHIHFSAEGDVDFKALLFIPATPPNIYYDSHSKSNVKIYSRRVLVAEKIPEFLPRFLFSIHGVVDSDSFPLNVSREHLQQSKVMKVISRKIVKSVLDTLHSLMKKSMEERAALNEELLTANEDRQEEIKKQLKKRNQFEKFYDAFKGSLKVGCYEDSENRKKIAKLLMFRTSEHRNSDITLDQYIREMAEDQPYIYYASGESYKEIHKSPNLQAFHKRGLQVLYLIESMDESCLAQLQEYEGKQFKSVQKGEVAFRLTRDEIEAERVQSERFEPLIKAMQERLTDVFQVKISKRLVEDPCTVVATEWGMSAHMEKVMKSYVVHKKKDDFMDGIQKRVFEINPEHPIILDLLGRVGQPGFGHYVDVLYSAAKLASGFTVDDPQSLSKAAYGYLSGRIAQEQQQLADQQLADGGVGDQQQVADVADPDFSDELEDEPVAQSGEGSEVNLGDLEQDEDFVEISPEEFEKRDSLDQAAEAALREAEKEDLVAIAEGLKRAEAVGDSPESTESIQPDVDQLVVDQLVADQPVAEEDHSDDHSGKSVDSSTESVAESDPLNPSMEQLSSEFDEIVSELNAESFADVFGEEESDDEAEEEEVDHNDEL